MGATAFASKRFEMVRRIGEGGMGIVYEVIDRDRGGARVAVKTLRNASAEHLLRLKREFRVMQEVQHPNLVALRELVCEDDRWYLAMDIVDGVDFVTHVRAPGFIEGAPPSTGEGKREAHLLETGPTLPIIRSHEAPVFDEPRLREALRQLAEGLVALHAAGMVHRDIKPSNVLVTREGRVVLLDFGLVAETTGHDSATAMVGTPAYMAPEQAASGEPGPEADWYAAGVLLYEALTGRLPFEGAALQVMLRKQNETPPPPTHVAAGVPDDLDALCTALLRFAPRERPSGGAVLRQLGSTATAARVTASASRTLAPPFVGRARELELLGDALRDSRNEGVSVTIEGESGVGKSRLVRRFCERLALEDAQAVTLSGRCYESESVPYKAFDGVVDALARLLSRMPDAQARELVPTRPAPLVQVFPVLRRVPAIADLVRAVAPQLDPFELRSRAFAALREMLVRLGDRRSLVVVVDDAQWADHDSLALLAEITRPPEAPRMLLVATIRTAGGGGSRGKLRRTTLDKLIRTIGSGTRPLLLEPLSSEESRELVTELAERAGFEAPRPADIEAIAAEAGGYPLFIDVLARQGPLSERKMRSATRLDEALMSQVGALDEDARKVVELVAVAGEPLPQRVIERAASMSADAFVRAVQRLRVGRLVAKAGHGGDDRVEPYHDRIARAIFDGMKPPRRAKMSRAIARALEVEPEADPEALARLWWEGGDNEQASRCAVLAGDRATSALAFDRAAGFYEQALVMSDDDVADDNASTIVRDRRRIVMKLAEALANAGRGKRAAEAFEKAAAGAPAAEALALRQRAADQLLRCGHFDEGIARLESVLASVGVRLPRTPLGAVIYWLFFRLVLVVRGLGYRPRDATQLSGESLVRFDTCWSAAFGLAVSDTVRASALQARMLLVALGLGERYRVAIAYGLEVGYLGIPGGSAWQRSESLAERARAVARESDQLHATAWVIGNLGIANYLCGRWRRGVQVLDEARDLFAQCPGAVWEQDTMWFFAVNCLAQLGELRTLSQRASTYLREAGDRGDLYATVTLRLGFGNLRWLVPDEPGTAQRQIDEAMAQWSKRGFHLEHFYELLARTNLDLYVGEARLALARVRKRWPELQRSLLPFRIQSVRVLSRHFRARAALACAALGDPDRDALLAAVLKDARRIERERMSWATPLAKLLRAGVAHVEATTGAEHHAAHERARAIALLRDAAAGFDAADMTLHAAVSRRALGAILADDEGRKLVEAADAWFAEQTVKRPAGFAAMIAPGLRRRDSDR